MRDILSGFLALVSVFPLLPGGQGSRQVDLQTAQRFVGVWEGVRNAPADDRNLTRLTISMGRDGGLTGSLTRKSASRERHDADVSTRIEEITRSARTVRVEGQTITVIVSGDAEPGFNVVYQGTLSSDDMLLVGSSRWMFNDGAVPPLAGTLHRLTDREERLAPAPLPYREGAYYLSLIPTALTRNFAAATNICVGEDSGTVRVSVALAREGDEWVGKSSPQDGSLVVRLRRASGAPTVGWFMGPGSYRVVGTISGAATNAGTSFRFDDKRRLVSLNADATIEGSVASGFISDGIVTGDIVFTSPDGRSTRCNPGSVSWWMTSADLG